jgi:dihydropyrimidine dehydrogenase (NAD+) subunit PreT
MKVNEKYIQTEISRCLLCYDPLCTKACPVGLDPAAIIKSLQFENFKGAVKKLTNKIGPEKNCNSQCGYKNNCQMACTRAKIDRPLEISKIHEFLLSKVEKEVQPVGLKT